MTGEIRRENFLKFRDLKGSVSSILIDCAFDSGSDSSPDLLFTLARSNEKNVVMLGMRSAEDGNAIRLIQSRKVEEVSVLTEFKIAVAVSANVTSTGQNCHSVFVHLFKKLKDSSRFHPI